jgi:peptidyl-prolyl cis-trans isomerase A (cyclophilin A)
LHREPESRETAEKRRRMPDRLAKLSVLVLCAALLAAAPKPATGPPGAKPVDVAIRTSLGTIVVRLDTAAAPITAKNFLHYVDAGTYNGATFYRTVRRSSEPQASIEVIQGGLNPQAANPMIKPIPLEPTSKTHLHNTDGMIAMARTSDPNSGSTEFFIDIGDDRFLDAGGPTGAGYAAFGKVTRGMDVVHKIQQANATGESLSPPIKILSIKRT